MNEKFDEKNQQEMMKMLATFCQNEKEICEFMKKGNVSENERKMIEKMFGEMKELEGMAELVKKHGINVPVVLGVVAVVVVVVSMLMMVSKIFLEPSWINCPIECKSVVKSTLAGKIPF